MKILGSLFILVVAAIAAILNLKIASLILFIIGLVLLIIQLKTSYEEEN